MDVKMINPFIGAVSGIMPQIGFTSVSRKGISLKEKKFMVSGVVLTLGIVGDKKGNVVYSIDMDGAKKIASTMMMGMPVTALDDMSISAISELGNMIMGNAATIFSTKGYVIDITPPSVCHGDMTITQSYTQNICVPIHSGDEVALELNIAVIAEQ